jgi:N-acetylglucosaminyl-diphospho-decaprenol L-rhamnosyltransferase
VEDLAVVVISTNEAHWLRPCLRTLFEHAGEISLDVVIADNQSADGTRELVEEEFPEARVVSCANHGFAHGNNRGLMTTDSRYVLFLNPDTEVVEGTLEGLVDYMDAHPEVGLAGCRQVDAQGELWPTASRFPSVRTAIGEALGPQRFRRLAARLGENELDLARYDSEFECDWTSGSFLFVRREALEGAGFLDERFFIYSEEVDLCLRIKRTGWRIRHLPQFTIVHHANKVGISPRMESQLAYARRQYALKNFGPLRRVGFLGAIGARHLVRWQAFTLLRRRAAAAAQKRALRTLVGLEPPPFGEPPPQAVRRREPVREPELQPWR